MDAETTLPTDWHEAEHDPLIIEKYNPKRPALFEHDEADIAVAVVPTDPAVAHAADAWSVRYLHGTATDPHDYERIAVLEDRGTALSLVSEFARTYSRWRDRQTNVDLDEVARASREAEL